MISQANKEVFSEKLLSWYHQHKRDLPWRKSRDPYHIWVSEIMLQQTRVDTVIPYFLRFIEKFPTIKALASAREEDVLKMWEGLGYYSRARNLQQAVKQVNDQYGGIVPNDKTLLSSLKGVGPYTTGALLSIAYNISAPAVDGNVMRVLARFFQLEEDITKPSTRISMEQLALSLIPNGHASDFNQALMEFGAMLCTPRSPYCLICPLIDFCSARLTGSEERLPIKSKQKAPRQELRIVAWIEGHNQQSTKQLFRQRAQQGLLAKMWEMPHVQYAQSVWGTHTEHQLALQQQCLQTEGLDIDVFDWMFDTEHIFSHIHWKIKVYRCKLKSELLPYRYQWVGEQERKQIALPTVFTKMFT